MEKVLYTKYNSTRKPEFQLKTSIIECDGEKYVLKQPIDRRATTHFENIQKNYEKLCSVPGKITPIPYTKQGNGLRFEFVEGRGLLDDVNFYEDSPEAIICKIRAAANVIFETDEQNSRPFVISEEFKAAFPNLYPTDERSFKVSNLDAIFSNYIIQNDKIICIDYEWVVDFDVPARFLLFRALLYLYKENSAVLEKHFLQHEFLKAFDFSDNDIWLYSEMDYCFQSMVHGEGGKYIYTARYEKPYIRLNLSDEDFDVRDEQLKQLAQQVKSLNEDIRLKDEHINNLTNQIELKDTHIDNLSQILEHRNTELRNLEKQTRVLKPLNKCVRGVKKINRKIFELVAPQRARELKLLGKYKYKYRHLWENSGDNGYEKWINDVESEYPRDEAFEYNPQISILMSVYNVPDKYLIPCIESVKRQTYTNWELCIADDASTWSNVKDTLKRYERDSNIKIVYREEKGRISNCSNSALELATGEYIVFLECNDILAHNALYEVVKKLNEDKTLDFIYSDEDRIDNDGKNRHMPHFKPDWSPDTLMSFMYTGHLAVFRKSIADEIGGLRAGYEGAQDYDFVLRFTEKTDKIAHISKVLYHWRERKESAGESEDAEPYIMEATKRCKENALLRRGTDAYVERIGESSLFRVNYKVKNNPKVSILIPSKDNYDILKRCVDSIYGLTEYRNFEIVLVDNGSNADNRDKYSELAEKYDVKYIYEPMEFNFSRMCNLAAANASGDYYLFLNDDTEIIRGEWLGRMLGQAQLPHVGAVGAKLVYPETGNIQHVGVINIANGPTHAFSNLSDNTSCYFARNLIEYDYCAVTAACLLVSKEKFEESGGFNEELAVAYNDVDLCFKLLEHGYYNVVRTDAVLVHYESVSRGYDLDDPDKSKRLAGELRKLYEMHQGFRSKDPFYNINLCQNKIDFSYNYTKNQPEYNEVKNKNTRFKVSDLVRGKLDIVQVLDTVYLEGWAFISGRYNNNDTKIKLLLSNEEKTYLLDTCKVYRPDVADNNTSEVDVDFTGFRCEIPKEYFEPGQYEVTIICRRLALKTDNIVCI